MARLVPHKTTAVSARSVYTIHALCHLTQSRIRKVLYVFSCNVPPARDFWQNDRDLLRANAVTRGWNGYRKKSQHRKLTLLEKKILQPWPSTTFLPSVNKVCDAFQ